MDADVAYQERETSVQTSDNQESDICDPVIPPPPDALGYISDVTWPLQAAEVAAPTHPITVRPEVRWAQSREHSFIEVPPPRVPFYDAPRADLPSDNNSIQLTFQGPSRVFSAWRPDLNMQGESVSVEAERGWTRDEDMNSATAERPGARYSGQQSLKRSVHFFGASSEDESLPSHSPTLGLQVTSALQILFKPPRSSILV